MKFLREDGAFDVEGYRHACRVFFLAQEIAVDFASYPTERITRRSHEFRPLGLGYANLGTLLMVQGLPYDSDEARAFAAGVTAIDDRRGLRALGRDRGQPGTVRRATRENRDSMLEVMRMHREAAQSIDPRIAPRELRQAAVEAWNRAIALGTHPRLPQRAGHRARAHRHHRPADGLRHDRASSPTSRWSSSRSWRAAATSRS